MAGVWRRLLRTIRISVEAVYEALRYASETIKKVEVIAIEGAG